MKRTKQSSRHARRSQFSRRGQSAAAASDRVDGVTIPRAFNDAGDQVHYFRRNLSDAVIHIPTTNGVFQVDYMPGYSGTGWMAFGSSAADIGNGDVVYAPFICQFQLTGLSQWADVCNVFSEFQVVAVKFTFRTSFGQSALPSTGGELPEIWSAAFPISNTPASNLGVIEALNPKRKVLGPNSVLSHVVAPRALYPGSPPQMAYTNPSAAWFNTAVPSNVSFAALQCAVRNFNQVAGSGVTILGRAEAFLKVRRWH